MIGAPIAVAQVCEPTQVDNNGQCTVLDKNANNAPAAPGKVMCTQSGHCSYFEGG